MPYKTIIIILSILLVLITAVLIGYNFFFKQEPIKLETGTETEQPVSAPVSESKIKALSQEPVLAAVADSQKVKFFSALNGRLWQADFDGLGLEEKTSADLLSLKKVVFSPDRTKTINYLEENGLIKKYLYDLASDKTSALNDNIESICFSGLGNKIAYHYSNKATGQSSINISNPDGSGWKNILDINIKDLIIEWPQENLISFRNKPSGLAQSIVYTLNPANGNYSQIINNTFGLSALWSPRGAKVLFSETDSQGQNLKLKIAGIGGQILSELDFSTLPEKCAWSQDERTLFCAVPKQIPQEFILPDDYYKGVFSSADDFIKINTETNQKSPLIGAEDLQAEFDAYQIFLNIEETYLFFINKKDGLLYSLAL